MTARQYRSQARDIKIYLIKYYFSGKPWRAIAKEINYSAAQVYRFHTAALEETEK